MNRIKELRQNKQISQQNLADFLNLSQQSVWKYEHNLSEPDIDTLMKMSTYFQTSIDYIVGNTDIPNKIDLILESQLSPSENALVTYFRRSSDKMQQIIVALLAESVDKNE